jgi:hypothetical protein
VCVCVALLCVCVWVCVCVLWGLWGSVVVRSGSVRSSFAVQVRGVLTAISGFGGDSLRCRLIGLISYLVVGEFGWDKWIPARSSRPLSFCQVSVCKCRCLVSVSIFL